MTKLKIGISEIESKVAKQQGLATGSEAYNKNVFIETLTRTHFVSLIKAYKWSEHSEF
jgi:hypothetical protein